MTDSTNPAPPYADALGCISSVYRALDVSDPAGVSCWFTSDAVWHRPDGTLTGTDPIEEMVRARPPERSTAHVVGNLSVEARAGGWLARYYLTVFAGQDGNGSFAAILSCEDELVETSQGIRVAVKRSAPLLRTTAP